MVFLLSGLAAFIVLLFIVRACHGVRRSPATGFEVDWSNAIGFMPMLICASDAQGRVVFVNQRYADFHGRTSESLVGLQFREFDSNPSDAASWHKETIATLTQKDRPFVETEEIWRKPDHSATQVRVTRIPLPNKDGHPQLVLTLGLDITSRTIGDAKVKEREELLSLVLNTAPAGIVSMKRDGSIYRVNPAFRSMLGYAAGDLENVEFSVLVQPDRRETLLNCYAEFIKGGCQFPDEWPLLTKTGNVRTVLMDAVRLNHSQDDVVAIVTVVDVTERRKAEEKRRHWDHQILQTQKLESLGLMSGGVAHDFNNILVSVIGNAGIGKQDISVNSPAWVRLDAIERAAERAAGLCRQMLSFAGQQALDVRTVALNSVIDEVVPLVRAVIPRKIVLTENLSSSPTHLEADSTQIHQILMNLVTNASEAIGDKSGEIVVTSGMQSCSTEMLQQTYVDDSLPAGPYVFLEVADNGCGMDAPTKRKIFDPFFSTKFQGRGLGLAAVLGIVRGHRGAIEIHSEAGHGTRIRVWLPASDATSIPATIPRPAPSIGRPATGNGKILIVDDEPDVRRLAKIHLEKAGYTVLTANDGIEALNVFREHVSEITAVLLDVTMPFMSGDEVLGELRKIQPGISIVLTSGGLPPDVLSNRTSNAITTFLPKPWTARRLVEQIDQVFTALAMPIQTT